MKKIIPILLAILILIPVFVVAVGQDDTVEVLIENKQIIQKQMRTMSISSEQIQKPKYEVKTITKKEFEELKKDSSILIQENIPKHILMDVSVTLIEADTTWNTQQNSTNITGEGQTVCILDTGAQTDHPALVGKNATCNIDCATTPGICVEDCSATDLNGHGTHVTGTIVSTHATYQGVTIDTKYIPIMVCDSDGSCPGNAVLAGIDWCISNKELYNITVISMSLGGGQYSSYCDGSAVADAAAIDNATANNITVVVATGNLVTNSPVLNITNSSAGISNPACIQNSLRVGNTDDSDNMASSGLRGSFFTDIITAPGVGIISTIPTSTTGSSSGTSMSTPHVSGVITLLNHYKRLESNTVLTPVAIKSLLFDSGKNIYDNYTNQNSSYINYSRVNAYQAILYSDEALPQTTQTSPEDSLLTSIGNTTFQCNATDNLQLKNLTLNIYNSTGSLFYNITNSSPTNNVIIINQTVNLSIADDYSWNCLSYDNQSNKNQTTNRTISTYSIQAQIITPENNTYTNQNETSFNCSTQSTEELSNITFKIYNSTALLLNITEAVSGLSNYSTFNFTLPNETTYYYNCESINNQSQTATTENYTITYDKTTPIVTLSSPANNSRITSPVTFTYSENETNSDFCNLTIDGDVKNSFTQTIADGTHYWNITCTDLANNSNISETRLLTIYTAPAPVASSGGGGGGGSTQKIYVLKEAETELGISKRLKVEDKIKFTSNSISHELTLNKIEKETVEITIQSEPITTTLYLNQPIKINLDNDETFDLEITLISIISGYANIQIKTISELVPIKHILAPIQNETPTESPEIPTESPEIPIAPTINYKLYLIILASIVVIIFATWLIKKRQKKKASKTKKEDSKRLKLQHIKNNSIKIILFLTLSTASIYYYYFY